MNVERELHNQHLKKIIFKRSVQKISKNHCCLSCYLCDFQKTCKTFWIYMVAENFSTIENIHVKINTMRATELGILWPCVPVISAHVQDDLRYIIVCNLTSIWYIVARFCHCALKSKKVHKDILSCWEEKILFWTVWPAYFFLDKNSHYCEKNTSNCKALLYIWVLSTIIKYFLNIDRHIGLLFCITLQYFSIFSVSNKYTVNSVLVASAMLLEERKYWAFTFLFKLLHTHSPTIYTENAASIDLDLKPYILYMLFVFVVVDITQHIHTKV